MSILRGLRSRILKYKIDHGLAPHGRTAAPVKTSTPEHISPIKSVFDSAGYFNTLLTLVHKRINPKTGEYEEIGRRVVKDKVVTDVFVNDLVDSLVAAAYLNDYKYHDSGTGTNAEAAGDTALQTPCGEARDTGSQAEGASANIYKTIAEHTYAGTFAITEWGVFDAASAGILMDRSVFSAINVDAGDKIEGTFQLTCTAGG